MAWSSHLLSTGSRDRSILHRDVRAPEDFTAKLLAHRSEVPPSLHPVPIFFPLSQRLDCAKKLHFAMWVSF